MFPSLLSYRSIYPLRAAEGFMRQRFDVICAATDKMLVDALSALRNPTPTVERLLRRLLPEKWDNRKKRRFCDAMENNVRKMIPTLRNVERNKYEVIGFGKAKRSISGEGPQRTQTFARGEAWSGSMEGEMEDFTRIRQPLLLFDAVHFETAPTEALKSDLVHELSHLCRKTLDTISAKSEVLLYARESPFNRNEINIKNLRDAWAEPDSDPAMHAATVEIVVRLLSMAVDPAQRRGLADIMKGGDTFRLSPEASEDS